MGGAGGAGAGVAGGADAGGLGAADAGGSGAGGAGAADAGATHPLVLRFQFNFLHGHDLVSPLVPPLGKRSQNSGRREEL